MMSLSSDIDIDIVWRWAGIATEEKRNKCRGLGLDPEIFPPYMDDIKYSMRSVLHNCRGWYRKVFLLVDDDEALPSWLDTSNEKLVVVRHSEFIPVEFLPTYNSNVIDSYIHRVPGLSDRFIVSDDDTYICKRIKSPIGVFFHASSNHLPIVRHYEGKDRHSLRPSKIGFVRMWQDALRKYNIKYTRIQHHVMPFYKPLIIQYDREIFGEDMKTTGHFKVRTRGDINLLRFSSGMCSTRGDAHMIRTGDWMDLFVEGPELTQEKVESILRKKPTFLCINNTHPNQKLTYQLLRKLFPRKSPLEK
jgi:hypothetical protein